MGLPTRWIEGDGRTFNLAERFRLEDAQSALPSSAHRTFLACQPFWERLQFWLQVASLALATVGKTCSARCPECLPEPIFGVCQTIGQKHDLF